MAFSPISNTVLKRSIALTTNKHPRIHYVKLSSEFFTGKEKLNHDHEICQKTKNKKQDKTKERITRKYFCQLNNLSLAAYKFHLNQ